MHMYGLMFIGIKKTDQAEIFIKFRHKKVLFTKIIMIAIS